MFELLGICLTLAALFTLNALTSLLASGLWRVFRARAGDWPAAVLAQRLFALRVFPPVIAIVCVSALLLPAYIAYEPRHSVEPVSLKLGALAAISAGGLLLALWRGVAAWVATHRLITDWLRSAEPIRLDQIPIPAYRLRHQFPVIAIVGAFRPKLFIADQLFQTLTREEMAAAIAHESGHLAARDNLKRALLRACRDALAIIPSGGRLDRAWAEASEAAADEHAARGGSNVALDLASTLVKIARLVPEGVKPSIPAGALLIGDSAYGIAQRVRRLTQLATMDNVSPARRTLDSKAWPWACFAAILIAAIFLANDPSTLLTIHRVIEISVSKLQ
ncbi:MAG TPA: M48 family metalloprotease [Blastocatellia bacterium]|nr:M48 family metalloprotease [Blastocatellia bacterium]